MDTGGSQGVVSLSPLDGAVPLTLAPILEAQLPAILYYRDDQRAAPQRDSSQLNRHE